MMRPDMDGKKKLEELVAGLDGVTPGPWAVWEEKTPTVYEAIAEMEYQIRNSEPFAGAVYLLNANGKCPATTGCGPSSAANAAHLARCDPDTILSISDAFKAMEAENERLRALIAAGDDAHRSIVEEADEPDYYRPSESGYSRADDELERVYQERMFLSTDRGEGDDG